MNDHCVKHLENRRAGVTILEVLFATGIVIFGILGIAALIPLAARNANQANEASEGQAYGQRYYAEFIARGFNNSANWRWFNDTAKTFGSSFSNGAIIPSTGSGGGTVSTPNRHAVCIDPGFYADPTTLSEVFDVNTVFNASQAYRVGLFPYYQDNYDPTSPAASPSSLVSPPALVNRPRLLRVSLHDPSNPMLNIMPAKLVQQLFSSVDDVATTLPKDKTLPPLRVFDATGSRPQSKAEFSWLATLVPSEFIGSGLASGAPEDYYTLSIVMMHRRDRAWFRAFDGTENGIPQGERLFGVTPLSGNFIGGDGGRVEIRTNINTDDEIGIGDWLMLSRFQFGGTIRGVVARWYRIIGVDGDAVKVDLNSDGEFDIWTRNVVLDGPDWAFADGAGLPTQATYVSNVVSVFERVIPVE